MLSPESRGSLVADKFAADAPDVRQRLSGLSGIDARPVWGAAGSRTLSPESGVKSTTQEG